MLIVNLNYFLNWISTNTTVLLDIYFSREVRFVFKFRINYLETDVAEPDLVEKWEGNGGWGVGHPWLTTKLLR